MANAKISDNSIFVPKTNITDVVGLAGYDNSGNVKISGTQLKASVLSGAIQTIAATSPLERTTGNDTVLSILEVSTTQDGYLSSSNFTAFSDADGTVKSVGGTGTVSGITLSGTVTTSGSLTLGGTLTIPSVDIISFLGYTPYNNTNPSNFTSNTGTVTNLVFSSPLTGGTIVNSGTVGITAASTNSDGYLTQSDWNTFDSKTSSTGTVTSVSGTGTVSGITLSGTVDTSGSLTLGGTLSLTSSDVTTGLGFTPYNNTNPSGFTSNTGTVTQVTTTAPLSGSVTSTGSLSITKADTNTDGYLTSTDWTTFNNKTSFAEPGIFSGGGTPTLATNVTGAEIRTLIGAGTGDGDVTADSTTAFTNKSGAISQWTNDANYTNNVGTVTANNTITFTNKSGDISQWNNDAGYITSAGDNTFVTGAALSGGTLTLTRNDSGTVTASGFLQIGATSSDALAGNTTTITTQQAGEITTNTAKTGITTAQATAISDNTLKTSFPGFGTVSGKALEGDTVIPTVNDGTLTISLNGTDTTFSANQSGDSSVSITTGDSDNFYVTGASYTAGTLTLTRNGSLANVTASGFLQVGTTSSDALAGNTVTITGTQAGEISANTAKTSFPGFGTTSTTALKGDTVIPPAAPVDSVNGETGVVVLTTSDITEGTNLYYTEARVTANTAVAANTAKEGITNSQANQISANTLKVSDTGVPALLNESGDVELGVGITAAEVRVAIGAGTSNLAIGSSASDALAGNTTIPTNTNQLTNGSGFLTSLSGAVLTTGNQTVAGTKTFSSDLIASSDIGIGTASPISQLHIRKTTSLGPIIQLENAYNGSGADTLIRFGDSTENYSYSVGSDDSANSFRISYNGTSYNGAVPGTNDFLIFSTSGNAEIPNGDLKVTLGSIAVGSISNSATDGRIDASNDVVAFSTSDIRLKDNIKTIDNALDKVKSIQGIEFDWIEKEKVHGNSGHDIGVIAQEIEKVLPDVVTTRDSGYKAVKYEKIVPLLIEAIKELSNQVNELKNK